MSVLKRIAIGLSLGLIVWFAFQHWARQPPAPPESGWIQDLLPLDAHQAFILLRSNQPEGQWLALIDSRAQPQTRSAVRWLSRLPDKAQSTGRGTALGYSQGIVTVRVTDGRTSQTTVAFEATSGRQLWQSESLSWIAAPPSLGKQPPPSDAFSFVAEDRVFDFLSDRLQSFIVCRDLLSGHQLWKTQLGSISQLSFVQRTGEVQLFPQGLWVKTSSWDWSFLDRATGQPLASGQMHGSGAFVGSHHYSFAEDGFWKVLALETLQTRSVPIDQTFQSFGLAPYQSLLVGLLQIPESETQPATARWAALQPETGQILWQFPLPDGLLPASALPVLTTPSPLPRFVPFLAADDNDQRTLMIADLQQQRLVWNTPLGPQLQTWHLLVADGRFYFLPRISPERLATLSPTTGQIEAAVQLDLGELSDDILPSHFRDGRLWLFSPQVRSEFDQLPILVLDAKTLQPLHRFKPRLDARADLDGMRSWLGLQPAPHSSSE